MILVDSHVHLHPCFSTEIFLDCVRQNFLKTAGNLQRKNFDAVIFLLDTEKSESFRRLKKKTEEPLRRNSKSRWRFSTTQEDESLMAMSDPSQIIFIIAGRQIVTKEKLEVLALGTTGTFSDGKAMNQILSCIEKSGAIAVIPWGFGKWMGKRGKLLTRIIEDEKSPNLFLGDNGGRPKFAPGMSPIKTAVKKEIRILRGTDPLPLPHEQKRVGSFGFIMDDNLNPNRPSADLKQLLKNRQTRISNFGRYENPIRFIQNQILIRMFRSHFKLAII